MALYGVRISDSHARNPYHARPIAWDVSRGSNLGHGRVANFSWPIGTSHGHLWPYVEPELLLMGLMAGVVILAIGDIHKLVTETIQFGLGSHSKTHSHISYM